MKEKTRIKATVVADSVDSFGNRLISLELIFPRFILAELNTHRAFSRNSASSRAIPLKKMVKAVQEDPFIPIAWQKDHTGMQGSEYHIDNDVILNDNQWLEARDNAIFIAKDLHKAGVTKQLCNRLLEPFMWHKVLVTSNKEGWDSFFKLRCPDYVFHNDEEYHFKSKKDVIAFGKSIEDTKIEYSDEIEIDMEDLTELDWLKLNLGQSEIHMMTLAEEIYDAINDSTPRNLKEGEWHIPYEDKIDEKALKELLTQSEPITLEFKEPWHLEDALEKLKIKISTGMCARTSYTTIEEENTTKSYETYLRIHDLMSSADPFHASPFEHIARCMTSSERIDFSQTYRFLDSDDESTTTIYGVCRNFKGFIQYRALLEM